jgi:transposase
VVPGPPAGAGIPDRIAAYVGDLGALYLGATAATTTTDDLVPEQLWQAIQPPLPSPPPRYGGRPRVDDRGALAGIVYQLRTGIPWRLLPRRQLGRGSPVTCWRRVRVGAPWRHVPECYGSWRALYSLFRRWQRAGVWAAIVTGLQTRADASGLQLPRQPAPACADAASPRPSPNPPTSSATASTAAEPEGVHPGSAPRTTEPLTPSNAASTGSHATVEWPPGMTSSPSATRPASTSPASTTGC